MIDTETRDCASEFMKRKRSGDEAEVETPACPQSQDAEPAIQVHRLPGHFGWRGLPALFVAGAGVILSFFPYGLWFWHFRKWVFIADRDNLFYLQMAAQPYYRNIWYLADPVYPAYQTYYSWIQFVPAAKLAQALGMGVFGVNVLWHLWAAIAVALTLYGLFFHFIGDRWLAAACAVFAMSDAGMLVGQPLVREAIVMARLLAGHPGTLLNEWPPVFLNQWRMVDPALGLPFLFSQILLMAKARNDKQWLWAVAAGIAFGCLFYVYFYFWTAAAAGLFFAWLVDRNGRRIYACSLAIGVLLGSPSLLQNLYLKSRIPPDSLPRVTYFLPIPRLDYFLLPRFALIAMLFGAWWIWRRKRADAIYLLGLGAGAILLSNNHVITGLDLAAGHWRMVWGPVVEVVVVAAAVELLRAASRWTLLQLRVRALFVSVLFFLGAPYLVALDTAENFFARQTATAFGEFSSATRSGLPPLAAGSVIGGDEAFCEFTVITEAQRPLSGYAVEISPWVSNAEWERRIAANAYLGGADRESFAKLAQQFSLKFPWGPWAVNPARRPELFKALMSQYDEVARSPVTVLDRFGVRYVALKRGQMLATSLRNEFRPLWNAGDVHIWERTAVRAADQAEVRSSG